MLARLVRGLRFAIPEGRPLAANVWDRRHRGVLVVLWLHAVGLFAFALTTGTGLRHALEEGGVVAVAAVLAAFAPWSRTARSATACVGLITSSAVLVHLSGGYIEAHFHFFVMVGLMALYQHWVPFLLAIVYVVVHHGTVGVLAPESVYNHAAAWAHPWAWAGIHGAFVAAMSAVCLVAWRVSEATTARLESILNSAADGIIGLDAAGSVSFLNAAAVRLTGWTELDVLGRRPDETFWMRDLAAAAVPRGLKPDVREASFRRRDGSTFPVELQSAPIEERGASVGSVVVFKDITDRYRADREREELLAREQAARAEAEAANHAKDDFLAVLSHELRTPLTAMLGWTRLMRHGRLDDATTRRAVETIERSAVVQSQLIDDLLDVSRIVAGKLHLACEAVDFHAVVAQTVQSFREEANAKGITLEAVLRPPAAVVVGDEVRLQQIVANLVANAVKFTPAGGRVDLAVGRDGRRVQLVVSDTGEGIDPAHLPHIFDRFRQADSSPRRGHGGLGLGLAIVRHLAALHGGAVTAHSEGRGQGARFAVDLPVEDDLPSALRSFPGTPPDSADPSSLRGLRILVVDDEPDTRDLVVAIIEGHGGTAVPAASAAEALALFTERRPFDLVVSDIGMPRMDGHEMLRRLRELEARLDGHAPVPAIALTAFAGVEDRAKALAAGFHQHIAKPLDPDHFRRAIRDAVASHRPASARR